VGAAPDIGAYEVQAYGFTLTAELPSQAIGPGESAVYALRVEAVGAFTADVALTHSPAPPSLTLVLTPTSVAPGEVATLTVTDTHSNPLVPGLMHHLVVTGTSVGVTVNETLQLLVGGVKCYLPLSIKQ
jgi:hypothetical protein